MAAVTGCQDGTLEESQASCMRKNVIMFQEE